MCKQRENQLVLSCFTEYEFNELFPRDFDNQKLYYIKFVLNRCGYNLTYLNVENFPRSSVMPLINMNCPNLKQLFVAFESMNDKDFENVFSNMNCLEKLMIKWNCHNLTLPLTLLKSLKKAVAILKELFLICESVEYVYLPASITPVSLINIL